MLATAARCNVATACIVAVLCCCGCGSGPKAHRIRSDTNDRVYPQRDIHFVEHSQRSKGVLVAVTSGFSHAFEAAWGTVLVPTPPTTLAGPVWTGKRRAGRALAVAIAQLPGYRGTFPIKLYGDLTRFHFRQDSVWVLGTDPFVLGLPAGAPKRTWREFAVMATGVGKSERRSPLPSFVVRYVVDEELDQPLDRLVVFPSDFWERTASHTHRDVRLSVVKLPRPLMIDQALDALAGGDPLRLGPVEEVPYQERFATDVDLARAKKADRERLMSR